MSIYQAQVEPSSPRLSRRASVFLLSMVAWTALAAAFAFYRESTYDYPAYLIQWDLILDGGDPWLGSLQARNAYGPVHVLLAPFVAVHPLLPKVLMLTVFLVVNMMLAWRVAIRSNSGWRVILYLLFVPLNGCIIIWGLAYGSNDILVAGFVGLALLTRLDDRMVWTGVLLGLAVLLKLYPAVLVILFSIDRRSISFRLLFSSAVTVVLGLFIPFLVWGGNSLNWLLFASERGNSQLSLWNQIINEPWLSGLHGLAFFIIDINTVLLALAFGLWLVVVWIRRIPWLPASIFGLFLVLFLYKVGHGQFWMTWLVLACGLLIAAGEANRRIALAALPTALGTSFVALVYDGRRQLSLAWEPVQQPVGWIFFLLQVLTLILVTVILTKQKRSDDHPSAEDPASTSS